MGQAPASGAVRLVCLVYCCSTVLLPFHARFTPAPYGVDSNHVLVQTLAEKVDVPATLRWLDAHKGVLQVYQEPAPPNVDISENSKKRALQAALAAENRRVKCAQARLKALRLSLDALAGSETAGASFVVRNGELDDEYGANGDDGNDEQPSRGSPSSRRSS